MADRDVIRIAPAEGRVGTWSNALPLHLVAATTAFIMLFREPMVTLVRDWWTDPDAAHGLLLFPLAMLLAWRTPRAVKRDPRPVLGLAVLSAAVLLRYASGLAAELFTMRASLVAAFAALVVFQRGWPQVRAWWLPLALVCLSVPMPAVVLNSLALPLQLKASAIGAALLRSRHVPVLLEGNVLYLPDRTLFVTEACSGLRSLTALIALGILIGGLWLRTGWARAILLLAAIPVAMLVNSVRVFLTGFLVYYVNPALADGFSHYTEGWVLFVVAFGVLGGLAWILGGLERRGGRGSYLTGESGGQEPVAFDGAIRAQPSSVPIPHPAVSWAPASALAIGVLLIIGIGSSSGRPLRMPLGEALPRQVAGLEGRDAVIPENERRVAGFTDYLLRTYSSTGVPASPGFSVYVGYYDSQTQGKTIHSPKNCLPGAGWEALQSSTTTIQTAGGPENVNRYLIQKGQEQALVLYWYQGRGRIQANEYAVKWNLLRDAALRRRSEEALVRIVVPITNGIEPALAVARQSAEQIVGELARALPG